LLKVQIAQLVKNRGKVLTHTPNKTPPGVGIEATA